jgi:uncharacterized membrane-anchored protein YitT (DUF2179 family)
MKAKKVLTYFVIVVIACVCALNYELFVFPNSFAPAGLNGICTMVQYVFGLSVGYLSLIINIPLAILVYFKVSKSLAVRSMVYVITFSVALLVLDHVDLSRFYYATENGTSAILGPLVAGVIYGTCYSYLLKASAYSGGTDFIAALIHKVRPDKSILGLIFTMNAIVAVASYFVYDYKMEPVILCILYTFTSSTVSERNTKSGRSAIRFEIITDHPQEISDAIITRLHHSATVISGKGMYTGKQTNIVICVVNKTQIAKLSSIIQSYPNTFAVMSSVGEVMGNFKHMTNDGKEELVLLDSGDGKAL